MRFNNGSQVEYEDCAKCRGEGRLPVPDYPGQDPADVTESKQCESCLGEKVKLMVTRPAGGVSREKLDDGGLRRAYAMALDGPLPKQQPSGDPAKFGDCPF